MIKEILYYIFVPFEFNVIKKRTKRNFSNLVKDSYWNLKECKNSELDKNKEYLIYIMYNVYIYIFAL